VARRPVQPPGGAVVELADEVGPGVPPPGALLEVDPVLVDPDGRLVDEDVDAPLAPVVVDDGVTMVDVGPAAVVEVEPRWGAVVAVEPLAGATYTRVGVGGLRTSR
jgi:hypothetical protein